MGRNATCCTDGGFALITVLLMVSLLAVIGITLNRSGGMNATISYNLDHGQEAYYIANAGLQHAIFALSGDPGLKGNNIFQDEPFSNGSYTVHISQDMVNDTPMGRALITSIGTTGAAKRTIQKRLTPTAAAYLPLVTDTTITKEEKYFNFGVSPYVKVGVTSTDRQKRGILRFDSSSLPADVVIRRAVLELYMYNRDRSIIGNNSIITQVHRVENDWTEGVQDGATCTVGATWSDSDCVTNWAAGDLNATVETSVVVDYEDINQWHTWNVTNLVRYWYDNPSLNYGLGIREDLETGNRETFIAHYASGEYSDVTLRPKLKVYYLLPK